MAMARGCIAELPTGELCEFYGMKVPVVPPHTPSVRVDKPDLVFTNPGLREPMGEFVKWATAEFTRMQDEIDGAVVSEMAAIVRKDGPVNLDVERLKGPSSTWTYLLDENQLGWGIEMGRAKNAGLLYTVVLDLFYTVHGAPHFLAPLFALTLLLNRRHKRNREVKTALNRRAES